MSTHHRLMLRLAAMIVPRALRADWLAEWQGELFHASSDSNIASARLTRFSWGAFPDAFWLRWHAPHRWEIRNSPLACILLLLVIAAAARAPREFAGQVRSYPAVSLVLVVACGVLLTSLNTRLTVLHPRTSRVDITPAWLFFLLKIALILVSLHSLLVVAASFAAWGAVQLLIVLSTVAFRWALRDQRARCPVCLRSLSKPVRVGVGSSGLLGWNGIEMMCCRGHGLLYVPESPSDHFHDPRWVTLDPSWRVLFDSPTNR